MKILLVSATHKEIEPYISQSPKHDILITGVGVPASLFVLTRHLIHHRYDLVVQAGIAGGNTNAFPLGSLVAIQKDCFAGLGSFEDGSFQSLSDLTLNSDKTWYGATHHWLQACQLPVADGATVNTLTNEKAYQSGLMQKWPHEVESMEGACCYFVCHQQQQACLQIRSISNALGDRNKSNWNIDLAINNLNKYLADWLQPLVSK